ncbi:hypothetical protein BC828DRAFT_375241 [Blastocladiella britannica]|nr:hypothetical protein BC828DRAFT_375241 [Blastocladiella britannica]
MGWRRHVCVSFFHFVFSLQIAGPVSILLLQLWRRIESLLRFGGPREQHGHLALPPTPVLAAALLLWLCLVLVLCPCFCCNCSLLVFGFSFGFVLQLLLVPSMRAALSRL